MLAAIPLKVENHGCVACPEGKTNGHVDAASGSDTFCDLILCAKDQESVAGELGSGSYWLQLDSWSVG